MATETVKVKNKLATTLSLNNAEGDSIQLPIGGDWHNVPRAYIEFQAPSLSVAEIDGYDYVNNCFLYATPVAAEVSVTVVPSVTTEDPPEPIVTDAAPLNNGGNRQNFSNGNNRPNNPQR